MRKIWLILALSALTAIPGCDKHTTSIYGAAERGDAAEVSRLLARGADPNKLDAGGSSPLVWAVERPNNGAVIAVLLSHGATLKPRSGLSTPLTAADPSNIVQLVNAGADVNWHLPGTGAPFDRAVMTGDAKIAHF